MRILLNRCCRPQVAVAHSIRRGCFFSRGFASERTKQPPETKQQPENQKKKKRKEEEEQQSTLERALKRFQARKQRISRVDIVSEQLCDDVLQRLSPFLNSNKPCDVLEFNPGVGILSSKIHELLQPRHHVLVESRPRSYKNFLEELASNPSFKLVSYNVERNRRINWEALLKDHFQEPVPIEPSGRNDYLLVILNLTDVKMGIGSFSTARYVMGNLEDALNKTGFHGYGMARVLFLMPPEEAELAIPRTVKGRKKISLMSEALSRHLILVAETDRNETINALRDWQVMTKSAARAAQRTVDANIVIPAGRERPPIPPAPEYSQDGSYKPMSYAPRGRLETDHRYLDVKAVLERTNVHAPETANEPEIDKLKADLYNLEVIGRRNNRKTYYQLELVDKWLDIMSVETELVRVMSETPTDSERLQEANGRLTAMTAQFAQEVLEQSVAIKKSVNHLIDDRQAALGTDGNLDRAILPWDRRPFEPLYIKQSEVWPPGSGCSILYFEPDVQSSTVRNLRDKNGKALGEATALHHVVISALGLHSADSLGEHLVKMFPNRPTMDIIKAVPALFPYIPKQLASSSDESVWSSETTSIYDKFEYDLSRVRVRSLPISVIQDLIAEYMSWPNRPDSLLHVNRALSGSMTAYDSGSVFFEFASGKAAGKVKSL